MGYLNLKELNNFSYLTSNNCQRKQQKFQTIYPQYNGGLRHEIHLEHDWSFFPETSHILHKFTNYFSLKHTL